MVPELLPDGLRGWVFDVADRVGCPVEYTAASGLIAAGSVIGRACGIRPKRHDDWTVIPNLWGMLVGSPGEKKSPALKEALAPLRDLERDARISYEADRRAFDARAALYKAQRESLIRGARRNADIAKLETEVAALDA